MPPSSPTGGVRRTAKYGMDWIEHLVPFPEDDDETLWRVLEAVPEMHGCDLEHEPINFTLVQVSADVPALMLKMGVPNVVPRSPTGESLLNGREVMIRRSARPECEQFLAETCPGADAQWFAIARLSFRTEAARDDFFTAYIEITGVPSC